jgi:predicted DNA-binding protein
MSVAPPGPRTAQNKHIPTPVRKAFALDKETSTKLKEYAHAKETTESTVIRKAVQRYLEEAS